MIGDWLQRHRNALLLLLVLLTVVGVFQAFKLPVALFPNISFPRIAVTVDVGDQPVNRMIIAVTRPLEQALHGVPGVTSIRSTSIRGTAEFSVNFNWNTNMRLALLQVQSALTQMLPSLPPGASFTAIQMDPNMFPIFGLALTSAKKNLIVLRDFAVYQLQPLLSTIPGISRLETLGGEQAEFHVLVDPIKLQAYGLTFDDVGKALVATNVASAVGRVEDYYRLYLILSDTRLNDLRDIPATILHSANNGIVAIEDIAQVRKSNTPQWIRVTANGRDAVLLNIIQQSGADTVKIAQSIKSELAALPPRIAQDIQIIPYYDQSKLITDSARSVRDAIIMGAILAAIILVFSLRNFRMTLIVAIILPCVLATTALLLHVLHMSFNIMTLGGMAAAVGLIIDDGVVMLEYIMRRLSEGHQGKSMHGPVLSASIEMLRPLMGSSLATIVIFIPLAFLDSVTGGFFKALALTMAAGLIISFFFSFLAVPLLGEMLLKPQDAKHLEAPGPLLQFVHHHYSAIMHRFLPQRLGFLLTIGALLIAGYVAYTQVGSGFMPHMDEGGFILDYTAKPGTSLTETDRLLRQVEKIIKTIPEVDSYSRRTGLQLGGGLTEAHTGDFFIHLKKPPRRNIERIMNQLREKISVQVPGLRIETAQLMEDLIGDLTAVPQPIEVKIFGDNPIVLQQTARNAADLLKKIPGVVEIINGITPSGDAINIKVNRIKAAALGLDPDAVTRQIHDQITGNVVSQVQSGQKMIGIRVMTPGDLHSRIKQLNQLLIHIPNGGNIVLNQIASLSIQGGQYTMTREDLKPMLAVTARIEDRDLGSTMRDVQQSMQKLVLPVGTYIKYGGLYQEQKKSFAQLLDVFIGAVLLVGTLLLFLYRNIYIVLSVLMTALLSLTGVFIGLWLTGTELNISAIMGMVMIVGMVTETAIFYFAELNTYPEHDIKHLITAGVKRTRPILMTSIIAILTLLPLALAIGAGSTMQQPLAIAIISGLTLGIPLILFVMPAIYLSLIKTHARIWGYEHA